MRSRKAGRAPALQLLVAAATACVAVACGGDDSSGGGSGAREGDIPTESGALAEFLTAREYSSFARESVAHVSDGPHASEVITFLSPTLLQSLEAGNERHTAGSATVKELYDDAGELTGWAVWVKTSRDSRSGDGFYWFETFDPNTFAPVADGDGVSICVSCHAAGQDYLLTPFPLR